MASPIQLLDILLQKQTFDPTIYTIIINCKDNDIIFTKKQVEDIILYINLNQHESINKLIDTFSYVLSKYNVSSWVTFLKTHHKLIYDNTSYSIEYVFYKMNGKPILCSDYFYNIAHMFNNECGWLNKDHLLYILIAYNKFMRIFSTWNRTTRIYTINSNFFDSIKTNNICLDAQELTIIFDHYGNARHRNYQKWLLTTIIIKLLELGAFIDYTLFEKWAYICSTNSINNKSVFIKDFIEKAVLNDPKIDNNIIAKILLNGQYNLDYELISAIFFDYYTSNNIDFDENIVKFITLHGQTVYFQYFIDNKIIAMNKDAVPLLVLSKDLSKLKVALKNKVELDDALILESLLKLEKCYLTDAKIKLLLQYGFNLPNKDIAYKLCYGGSLFEQLDILPDETLYAHLYSNIKDKPQIDKYFFDKLLIPKNVLEMRLLCINLNNSEKDCIKMIQFLKNNNMELDGYCISYLVQNMNTLLLRRISDKGYVYPPFFVNILCSKDKIIKKNKHSTNVIHILSNQQIALDNDYFTKSILIQLY